MPDHRVDTAPSLVDLLTVLQRQAVRGLAAVLAEDGFTVDQWRALRGLADGEGHPMGDLAESLQIAPASLTRVMDGLADGGLVFRRQPTSDRRRVTVHLARRGVANLQRLEEMVAAHEDALQAAPQWGEGMASLRHALGRGESHSVTNP